jgi:hypothetical protein
MRVSFSMARSMGLELRLRRTGRAILGSGSTTTGRVTELTVGLPVAATLEPSSTEITMGGESTPGTTERYTKANTKTTRKTASVP